MKIFARFSIFRQYIGKKGQYIDKKVGRRADFLPGSTTILQGSRWVVDAALSCCGRFLLLQGVTMPMPSLVAPTFSMRRYFLVAFLILILTVSNVTAAKLKRGKQLDRRPTGRRMLLRRNVARSQSRIHPCNMVEGHSGDNENVLLEEVDAGAMDEDEQCITAEGKDEEIFIAKMFNRHSYGEKEYNPPKKFHIGKATPLSKDKKMKVQWQQKLYLLVLVLLDA